MIFFNEEAVAEAGRVSMAAQAAPAGGSKLLCTRFLSVGEVGVEAGRNSLAAHAATAGGCKLSKK